MPSRNDAQLTPTGTHPERGASVDRLRQTLRDNPGQWTAHNELGDALMAEGRGEEAIGEYMAAARLNPRLGSACLKIGRFFLSRGLADPAWPWFSKVIEIDSSGQPTSVHENPSNANPGKANSDRSSPTADPDAEHQSLRAQLAALLSEWIAADPQDRDRGYLAAALLGDQEAKKAPDLYVAKLFDHYAERFDEHLTSLGYQGPNLIAAALAGGPPAPPAGWDVLDIGCGTGLVGQLLRPHAKRLVGVDLSENMVQKATERGVYDELCTGEMNALMADRPDQFDIVTAGDVLTYLGDLDEFVAAVKTTLRPGGRLLAIFESLPVDQSAEIGALAKGAPAARGANATGATHAPATPTYHLHLTGRFSHSEQYVCRSLQHQGFGVEIASRKSSRINEGKPVPSFLVVAQKPAAD